MPLTKYITVLINGQTLDLDQDAIDSIAFDYALETPEEWQNKQSSSSLGLSFPSTKNNDKVFDTFYNPNITDTTTDNSFREWMDIVIYVNGTNIVFQGVFLLASATITDKPERYFGDAYSGNGDWLVNGQNLTLWDCLPIGASHTFDVATIEASWAHDGYESGVLADILANCFVYAPVRYGQPFGDISDPALDLNVNIYNLRPSLFILPMIYRGFQQLGYAINSQFFGINGNTLLSACKDYANRLVLPWVWGDFYDLTSQLTNALTFKSYGTLPGSPTFAVGLFYATNSKYYYNYALALGSATQYIQTGGVNYFQMPNIDVPNGYDNLGLYSFDDTTGTMIYNFNSPPELTTYIGANVSLNFSLSLFVHLQALGGDSVDMQIEVWQNGTLMSSNSILPSGPITGSYPSPMLHYPDMEITVTPTTYNFTVPNVNNGDILRFRIKSVASSSVIPDVQVIVMQSGYLNANPGATGASYYQYDVLTQKWGSFPNQTVKQPMYSTFQMTGLLLQPGQGVNFQQYDNFRNYKFFDLLKGLTELFNLEIQTDPINKVVTIEPMLPVTVQNPYDGTDISFDGYFRTDKMIEWSAKMDKNKESRMTLFNSSERQIDFNFKQDGSDGGQNIYGARYKGIYLNNVIKPTINQNLKVDNSIIAGVPGASRYMLPNRFAKGNKQLQNSFFSATMHYCHMIWANYAGNGGIAPQLVTIFPENISGSSSSAVTATFEPKLCFYHGQTYRASPYLNFPWKGLPTGTPTATALPLMYSVFYNKGDITDNTCPILTYCDQRVEDYSSSVVKMGIMKLFHLQRLAIMRNGQLFNPIVRLNLSDICNFEHRESLIINQSIYALINIDKLKLCEDESVQCSAWRIVTQMQIDLDNCYPSSSSMSYSSVLSQYDLKYAPLLLFQTDIPQV